MAEGSVHQLGKFRVLTINDVYAFSPVQGLGGYAEISTLIEKYRTKNTLVMINGDFLGGSPMGEHFQGKCVIDVLNAMGIDYCVIGNHEFDFGNEILQKRMEESSFRWLGSNIRYKKTGELFNGVTDTSVDKFTYKIKHTNEETEEIEVRVGLFGVCTLDTPVLSWPGKDIKFNPVLECAIQKNQELDQKCDLLIGVTHVDLSDDLEIADSIKNLDLILGGHEHFPYNHVTKSGTLIFKAGQNAYWLGLIDFDIELHRTSLQDGQIENKFKFYPSWRMIANKGFPANPKISKIISEYREKKAAADSLIDKDELICIVKHQPLITKTAVVRCGSAQIMNVIADAMWKRFTVFGCNADLAIINGGIVRGDSIYAPNTKITRGILMEEIPFPLKLVMMEIKGKFIVEALEQHIAKYPAPVGSYPHVSGNVKIVFNDSSSAVSLKRIKSIFINGAPLDDEKEYRLTTTMFLSIGGDNCSGYTNGKVIGDPSMLFDVVIAYLKNLSELDATLEERFVPM